MGGRCLFQDALRLVQPLGPDQRPRPGLRRRGLGRMARRREHRERLGVRPGVRQRQAQGDAQRRAALDVGRGAQTSHLRLGEALAALYPAAQALEHPGVHAQSNGGRR